jgi:hypothetical protein
MTLRHTLLGLAIILGLSATFYLWLALASFILIFRDHLLAYVRWPQAAFLWWDTYDSEGMSPHVRSAGWLALELLGVGLVIGGSQLAVRIRRQPDIYGTTKQPDDKTMADAGIATEKRR